MRVDDIFARLWEQYSVENPSVKAIHNLFESEGESIKNDHVAFRTFNHPSLGIDVLAAPFISAGYQQMGTYHFPQKKLAAKHFEMEGYPRVFISELLVEEFSKGVQEIVSSAIDTASGRIENADVLALSGSVFEPRSYSVYQQLREESEYAAWVYAFGYRANHFTISINNLTKYNSIQKLNSFLKANDYQLNTSGGEVKGSVRQLLEQSSTLADNILVEFQEGSYEIPSCYYEFAHRHPDASGKTFSGFIAGSADKIFESTNFRG